MKDSRDEFNDRRREVMNECCRAFYNTKAWPSVDTHDGNGFFDGIRC
jgi:hypothetical protein